MKKISYIKRRTKIVCTLGPSTGTASVIDRLIRGGMSVARLNLAHSTPAVHSHFVRTVRRVSQRLDTPVAVLIDLPGAKYRIGRLKGGQITLRKGSRVTLTSRDIEGDETLLSVSLPYLAQNVKRGNTILLDDGAIKLKVLEINDGEVLCRVTAGGALSENRGLVVPGMRSSGRFITDTLREYILFAVSQNPDYLAISFITGAEDVISVKTLLRENNTDIPVIAKIERVQAVRNFDSILAVSDGIMVARGDLGVDIPLERVPLIQKEIIHKCNRAGKPVITATQMLESMVNAASPTRAEVTDVANAIFDGTDAIMLSAETSIGKYPVPTVKMMDRIAREAEKKLPYENLITERGTWIERETDELISYSACHTAYRLGAAAIVAFTQSGSTARRVSKYRPKMPILAITPDNIIAGRLLLHWGVYPFQVAKALSVDELFTTATRLALETGVAKSNDLIVITGGIPVGVAGSTNLLKVEKIA
jgi:pyruvate kinase